MPVLHTGCGGMVRVRFAHVGVYTIVAALLWEACLGLG